MFLLGSVSSWSYSKPVNWDYPAFVGSQQHRTRSLGSTLRFYSHRRQLFCAESPCICSHLNISFLGWHLSTTVLVTNNLNIATWPLENGQLINELTNSAYLIPFCYCKRSPNLMIHAAGLWSRFLSSFCLLIQFHLYIYTLCIKWCLYLNNNTYHNGLLLSPSLASHSWEKSFVLKIEYEAKDVKRIVIQI